MLVHLRRVRRPFAGRANQERALHRRLDVYELADLLKLLREASRCNLGPDPGGGRGQGARVRACASQDPLHQRVYHGQPIHMTQGVDAANVARPFGFGVP